MILRRPNTRASIERAPGPSKDSASKTPAAKMAESLVSKRVDLQRVVCKKTAAIDGRAIKTATTGVKNPAIKSVPPRSAAMLKESCATEFHSDKQDAP